MKILFLAVILFLLISTKLSFSALIDVGVSEDIQGKIVHESSNVSLDAVNFSTEFYNIGSVAYTSRARIYIYDSQDNLIFNGWSQEQTLMPGDKGTFDVYWYSSTPGDYSSKLRFYFGNEILEGEKTRFQISETLAPEDVFEVSNFRTYDDHVVFDIKSKKDVTNVVIIPYKYVSGWIFEQKTIDSMKKDYTKTISLNYYPTAWMPTNLTLGIVAENGKYYSESTFKMEKGSGVVSMLYSLLDSLKLIL